MDLYHTLFDEATLRALATDFSASCQRLAQVRQTDIYGGKESVPQTDASELVQAAAVLADAATPLHELQFMLLTIMYVSDSLVKTMQAGTPEPVFNAFFFGTDSILEFRKRFELHLLGQYKKHDESSARKSVQVVAKTPLEAVVYEVLLLVVLYGSR